MTEQPRGSALGIAAAAIGVFLVGLLLFGGLALLLTGQSSQPSFVNVQTVPMAKTMPPYENFILRVENATRQPDGSWKIFLTGRLEGGGNLEGIQFSKAQIADLAGECQVTLPAGPPFRNPVDLVIRTPVVPAERESIRFDYVLGISGSGPYDFSGDLAQKTVSGGFSDTMEGTLAVGLTTAVKTELR